MPSNASSDVTVQLSRSSWTDTGLVIPPGGALVHVTPVGEGITSNGSATGSPLLTYAYPDGVYGWEDNVPSPDPYDPDVTPGLVTSRTFDASQWAAIDPDPPTVDPGDPYPIDRIVPYCLVLARRTDGSGPPGRRITDGYRCNRGTTTFLITDPGRLWLIFNDAFSAGYENNLGAFHAIVTIDPLIDPLQDASMPRYLFSTGLYRVSLPLPKPALSRILVGAPAAATQPLDNLLDDTDETVADLPQTDGTNYTYLRVDFGSAKEIGRVILGDVVRSGNVGAGMRCYAAATAIANGDFSTATELTAVAPTGADLDWEFTAPGGGISRRYLYIVRNAAGGGTGTTIGDLDIRSREYQIGALQSITPSFPFEIKELRGAAIESNYPIADACFNGQALIQAETAELVPEVVRMFSGAMIEEIAAAGGEPAKRKLSHNPKAKPLAFVGELRAETSDGKEVRIITYRTFAPGFTWSTKREDFATKGFSARAILADADQAGGRIWRITIEQ